MSHDDDQQEPSEIVIEDANLIQRGPEWLVGLPKSAKQAIVRFAVNPRAYIVMLLTAGAVGYAEADILLRQGESAIEIIMDQYLFQTILLPAGLSVFDALLDIVAFTIAVFQSIAAIPRIAATSVGIPIINVGTDIASQISELNMTVAQELSAVGLPAPVFASVFVVVEIGVFAYGVWIALQVLENFLSPVLPIEITDTLRVVTAPIRNFLNGLT